MSIQDSNLDWLIQSQMCYHYTNGQTPFVPIRRAFDACKSECKDTLFFHIGQITFSFFSFVVMFQFVVGLYLSRCMWSKDRERLLSCWLILQNRRCFCRYPSLLGAEDINHGEPGKGAQNKTRAVAVSNMTAPVLVSVWWRGCLLQRGAAVAFAAALGSVFQLHFTEAESDAAGDEAATLR